MSVDLEAIAQRGRCDVSNLRLALPLLEQGYTPPFLARYRRDELGGLDEATLWALSAAVQSEQQIAARREELLGSWEQTPLADPALGHAIKKANSQRMLARLARRLKSESRENANDSARLAVRLLSPRQGDNQQPAEIAGNIEEIEDATSSVAGLDDALAKRLAGDPRLIGAAVRWLAKHARIHIAAISDPHGQDHDGGEDESQPAETADASSSVPTTNNSAEPASGDSNPPAESGDANPNAAEVDTPPESNAPAPESNAPAVEAATSDATATVADDASDAAPTAAQPVTADSDAAPSDGTASSDAAQPDAGRPDAGQVETVSAPSVEPSGTEQPTVAEQPAEPAVAQEAVAEQADPGDQPGASEPGASEPGASEPGASEPGADSVTESNPESTAKSKPVQKTTAEKSAGGKASNKASGKPSGKTSKKQKKVSPRQRRRRWLVGVLKPLEGKRLACDKLSSFQIVMLGRALRSQVAQCSFEYDATKLVAELQRVAAGLNRKFEDKLCQIVLEYEASIREAAEAAWWDDLHERASARLVGITADHLSRQVNRGAVEAKVVMAIDAVGPRTAATAIVSADGRMLYSEDLPCQLSAAQRTQAVTRMGELIHTYHVDLLVISNGPSRRATMIALGDLIGQSPSKSIRWTLADRSGADAYASSSIANDEMRSTPRRFRAAAWLAFSVLQPAQALAKVDPLKLRLSSFQRELSDDAIAGALRDVMTSGASRGGVDVNSAPTSWLQKLPGVTADMAKAIDRQRRDELFGSRQALLDLEHWESAVHSRQAIPFLRVFAAEEVLDGTLIHPEDYALAKKLASTLEIELPPAIPPGYEAPDYSKLAEPADPTKLVEVSSESPTAPVEDFSSAGETAPEFVVDAGDDSDANSAETPETSEATESSEAAESSEAVATDATETENSSTDTPSDESAAATDSEDAAVATGESESTDASDSTPAAETPETNEPTSEGDATPASDESPQEDAATPVAHDIPERILRPRPERAKTDKCIKEWQIGARRTQQLVQWLCDPFGDSDSSGNAPAVMDNMPTLNSLKPGEQAIGVVVGVMPFGVFVELAPDCSGLIHVSRISDSYVEDLHEAVQVGDVVTAWVSGIDEKRRRVALSALSPQREAELEEARRARPPRGRGGGQRGRGPGGQRGGRPEAGNRGGGNQSRGNRGTAAGTAQGQSGGGQARGGQSRGGGQERGGRRRDGRGRDGGRGNRREKKPESYRVVGKKEVKPISDAMQKGEEPLRSFGDLLQFFDQSKPDPKADAPTQKPAPQKPAPPQDSVDPPAAAETGSAPASETPALDSASHAGADVPTESASSKAAPTEATPTEATPTEATPAEQTAPSESASETSTPNSAADSSSDVSSDTQAVPPKQDETPSADASN